jgi:hypothetical protein
MTYPDSNPCLQLISGYLKLASAYQVLSSPLEANTEITLICRQAERTGVQSEHCKKRNRLKSLILSGYENYAIDLAPQVRLELTTHGLTVRCSNQLSY